MDKLRNLLIPELKFVKGVARLTRQNVRESYARAYHPSHALLHLGLQRECLWPEYFFYTWPEKKLIYIEVPKSASTFVLTTMAKGRHGMDFVPSNPHDQRKLGLPGIDQLGSKAFFELASDPETLVFTVVRHPVDRALSCFLDKFENANIGGRDYLSRIVTTWWHHKNRKPPKDRPITFEEFCLMASETAHVGLEGHWALQSRIIPTELLVPHRICRFENLIDDFLSVLRQVDADEQVINFVEGSRRKPRVEGGSPLVTPELHDLIVTAYEEDFKRFNYPIDLPTA